MKIKSIVAIIIQVGSICQLYGDITDYLNPKRLKHPGLTTDDLDLILNDYGLHTTVGNFFERPDMDFGQYLHTVIEGGPALLSFTTKDELHIVPVIGHTLNSDEWYPEANYGYIGPENIPTLETSNFRYLSSSKWIDHFLIHDDNLGMYFCMGSHCLDKIIIPKYDPMMRVHSVIGIFPEEIKLSPGVVEQHAAKIICDSLIRIYDNPTNEWGKQLKRVCTDSNQRECLLLRTLMATKKQYLEHLKKMIDHKKNSISEETIQLAECLPDKFWMTEFSLPNLYTANKSKLGEATFYINKDVGDTFDEGLNLNELLISIRSPQNFWIRDEGDDFFQHDCDTILSHTKLYRNDCLVDPFEW